MRIRIQKIGCREGLHGKDKETTLLYISTLVLWIVVSSMQVTMALAVREADRRGGGVRKPSFRILYQVTLSYNMLHQEY
jgi:hypothetical protein